MRAATFVFGFVAAITTVTAQSDFVPPPPCLKSCMDAYPCTTCSSNSTAAIDNCVSTTCYFRDVSYAHAYFSNVCQTTHGYVTEAGDPSSFVAVPAASCTPSAEKRGVRFSA